MIKKQIKKFIEELKQFKAFYILVVINSILIGYIVATSLE